MDLKTLLGDELYNQVLPKVGDNQVLVFTKDQKVLIDDGTLIPKYRLDEVIETNKSLKFQNEKHEKDLNELKKSAVGNEALLTQIETLKTENKDIKSQSDKTQLQLEKTFALKESLFNAGVKSAKARELLSKNFDIDKIEIAEDGKIKGFDDLIKPIKEDKAFSGMFGESRMQGQQHNSGDVPTPGNELQMKLDQALKDNRPLAEVVSLKRQIAEQAEKN